MLIHEQKERYQAEHEKLRLGVMLAPFSNEESSSKALAEIDKQLDDYRRDFYADLSERDEMDYGRPDRQHTA